MVDPAQIITEQRLPTLGRAYPRPLEPELEPWHVYITDSGHSILVAVASQIPEDEQEGDVRDYLVPAPVRMVQRVGWRRNTSGFLIAEVPYD